MAENDVSRQRFTTNCIALGRRGVTLLELVIVLAIISIMMGLLFPAIHMVVQEARKTAGGPRPGHTKIVPVVVQRRRRRTERGLARQVRRHRG